MADLKIILLGDSAVGKSKLMERFLLDSYVARQESTFALALYRYTHKIHGKDVNIDFWDTAGQERFQTMHPSYYMGAHCCVLVFDITRKVTYKNLDQWYNELTSQCGPKMPIILIANKIDLDPKRASKAFAFAEKKREERGGKQEDFPFYFVSAADGSNVVTIFTEAISKAWDYKHSIKSGGGTFVDDVLLFIKEEESKEDGLFTR